MTNEIGIKIISAIINYVVPLALGYCISLIGSYRKIFKKIKKLEETQLMNMRNDLSNKFYVYDALNVVEDYLIMSFREKCEKYFEMGGDNWIHPMYDKSFKWKIKPTGYLK